MQKNDRNSMNIIISGSNARIKELVKLNKDARLRRQMGVFIVEGIRMFRELPADRVREVYISESAYAEYGDELAGMGLTDSAHTYLLSDGVFSSISQTKSPQGCMAVVECSHAGLEDVLESAGRTMYLVLDAIQDPGNMGTIIRSAEAAGVTAVVISGDSCDPYNPKCVRATMGAIFRVPLVVCSGSSLADAVSAIKNTGVIVYGAHLNGDGLYDINFPDKVAFLIGNEGNGLSDEVSASADRLLRIPMEGRVESLNAGVSAAILSYEVMRQRKYDRQN